MNARTLMAAACLITLAGCALSPTARVTEATWQTLNVIDTGQSITGARNPGVYAENDPLTRSVIGRHPTEAQAYEFRAAFAVLHAGVTFWLDHEDTGRGGWHVASLLWQTVSLGNEGLTVVRNATLPIGLWEGSHVSRPSTSSCNVFAKVCP